ncbi:hypothetical protein HYV80_01340 [Candidatus Woesearchaeota archaeon]|nr:hypothetical protein [Candidatus Woesearchaeota archaeon]
MAFKRYIYKHGKKLGPYYYENVRGPDGSVKTIYLGTNPGQHTRHKIRKPLFFLILVLMLIVILGSLLFFMQNRSYIFKSKMQEPDFDMDQILLKVLIKHREFIEKQLRVMYTGTDSVSINVAALGLEDIIKIDSPDFTLKPGQTKIIAISFSSFMLEHGIEQQPGIYVGKLAVSSQKALREIPVVAEIETKNVLFDMNLNPVAIERRIKQGAETTIEVKLFNLESIESANIDVEYFVKDMNGNTILTESETVVVKTQASFFKTISIPKNLKPGFYVFAGQVKFGNSVGTASYLFEVTGLEEASFAQFCKNSIVCLGLSLTTILLVFAVMAYSYFFIGAYLYERFAGSMNFQKKKREEPAESPDEDMAKMFDVIKDKAKKWTGSIGIKFNGEEKEPEPEKEELEPAEDKGQSAKSDEFYKTLEESRKAVGSNDLPRANKFYIKARELYGSLSNSEKSGAYREFMELYSLIGKSVESLKKNEEKKIKKIELEKQLAEKRKQYGLKKQKKAEEKITLLKKQEKLEKKKAEEEGRKARELTGQKKMEQQMLAEEKKELQEIRANPVPEKKEAAEQSRLPEFYSILNESDGAAKSNDASRLKELYREARRIYDILPNQERHEAYGKLIELHKLAKEQAEEQEKEKRAEAGGNAEEKQSKPEVQEQMQAKPEKAEPEEAKLEKKPGWLGSIFRKKPKSEPSEKAGKEPFIESKEKPKRQKEKELPEQNKRNSEIDELEAAIKQLGMFKHVEKGKGISESKEPKEKKPGIFSSLFRKHSSQEQPKKSDYGKIEKFRNSLDKAKDAIKKNDIIRAKDFFSEARSCYLGLESEGKDKAYAELMEVQDKLEKM